MLHWKTTCVKMTIFCWNKKRGACNSYMLKGTKHWQSFSTPSHSFFSFSTFSVGLLGLDPATGSAKMFVSPRSSAYFFSPHSAQYAYGFSYFSLKLYLQYAWNSWIYMKVGTQSFVWRLKICNLFSKNLSLF